MIKSSRVCVCVYEAQDRSQAAFVHGFTIYISDKCLPVGRARYWGYFTDLLKVFSLAICVLGGAIRTGPFQVRGRIGLRSRIGASLFTHTLVSARARASYTVHC